MRRFDTVLFDLDGTLLDTLDDLLDAANHTLRELGYPERTRAEIRSFLGNGAETQLRRALGAGASEETVQKALALYKPYYAAHCQIKTKPYAGVVELMAALKAEGFRLAVVSNKLDDAVKLLVAQHFGALADAAMGETAQRRRKPAPDMVNDALAALGADKSRAVYVGDSEVDVETARNAGIPCISVCWGFRDREQLVEAGAAEIAADAGELKALLEK
ncbi:HAD family hydrolase [Oscillibacter valericigenes]|nr:HAD family hydrolase [Oscillibacter valericigenes]